MKSSIECIPCLARQAMEASGFATRDEAARERVVRLLLREIAGMDFDKAPPVAAQKMHHLLRHETGIADPYQAAKRRFNAMALQLRSSFEGKIAASEDPFAAAVRLAIAGNVIDLGVKGDLSASEAFDAVRHAFDTSVEGDIGAFKSAVASAEKILYLTDNAGEIVFDVPLIRALPYDKVTVAVRGGPVINDATMDDAVAAGIPNIAPVIDNGSDAPATILEDCSADFRRAYDDADLIIAKGQGNYETLCDEDKNIYFLFKVKCSVVSAVAGLPIGAHVLYKK